jgi:hypothetical protein
VATRTSPTPGSRRPPSSGRRASPLSSSAPPTRRVGR